MSRNRSEASPPGSSRKRAKYNRACTSCHQAQRKCDRRWEVEGASCSRCTGWGLNCVGQPPKPRASGVSTNTTDTSADGLPIASQAELQQSDHHPHHQNLRQPRAYNIFQNTGIAKGIGYANHLFPGVFNQERFVQRSRLPADSVNPDDHQHFSLMLLLVFRLLDKNPWEDGFRELLDVAKEAYGRESEVPTLATVMAVILLSWGLFRLQDHARFAKDLLANAHTWLDSYEERLLLRDTSRDKIDSLLEKVHALAKEGDFELCVPSRDGVIQCQRSSPRRAPQESQPNIAKAPAQRTAVESTSTNLDISAPLDQLNPRPPPRHTLWPSAGGYAPTEPSYLPPLFNSPSSAGPSNGLSRISVNPTLAPPSATGVVYPLAGVYDGCIGSDSNVIGQQAMAHAAGSSGPFFASNKGHVQVAQNSPSNHVQHAVPSFIRPQPSAQYLNPLFIPPTLNPHHRSWADVQSSTHNMGQVPGRERTGGIRTHMEPYPNADPGSSNGAFGWNEARDQSR